MGKARTPGPPWYLRPLALLIAGVLLCVVGVCYGRARLAGRAGGGPAAGQVARRGCPCAGAGLGAPRPVPVPDPASLPRAYFARAEAALGDGYIYLVLAQSKSPAGEVIGLFTHRDYNHISLALSRTWTPWSATTGGEGIAFPGLNRETVPGLARRRGPPCWSTACPPPGTRSRSSSAAWGRSTRRAAPTTCWASSSPWPGSPTRCSAPSSSTGCCGWRGSTTSAKTPSRCAPWTLWTWTPRGP